MEKIHDFKDSLQVEQSQFERQDEVYRRMFGHEPNRLDYDKYTEAQRDDIDLTITNHAGEVKTISEKYRPIDYNDILFEVFSVFPNDHGWIMKSKADILAYWFPQRLVLLDMKQLVKTFTENKISEQLWLIDSTRKVIALRFGNKQFSTWCIRALNKTYSSLSVTLGFSQLDRLKINYSLIPLE